MGSVLSVGSVGSYPLADWYSAFVLTVVQSRCARMRREVGKLPKRHGHGHRQKASGAERLRHTH